MSLNFERRQEPWRYIGTPDQHAECAQIRELGYVTSAVVAFYGRQYKFLSDPFPYQSGIAVRAVSDHDRTPRVVPLPVSVLTGEWHPWFSAETA